MKPTKERFISIDVETSGPIPGEYSMLTIGACDVEDPRQSFSCKIQPISDRFDPEAMKVTGLSLVVLRNEGLPPEQAMKEFSEWLTSLIKEGEVPIFVGLNAPFDWSFVNYYFHRFLATNPFGFTALDIKAYYMGVTGCSWQDTKSSFMVKRLKPASRGAHDALEDARFQAELFRLAREFR